MQKLKNRKIYHFGMGILIIFLQTVFQISNSIYLFGFMLILYSMYEFLVIKKLLLEKEETKKITEILNEFKWINCLAIIPVLLLTAKLIIDATNLKIGELIFSNSIFWINVLVIGGVSMYWLIKRDVNKIEKEITGI